MTTTHAQARNEIFKVISNALNDGVNPIIGYIPNVYWQNVEQPIKPASDQHWGRASIQTVFAEQTSLSTCSGKLGQKRYTESGLVFFQWFAPMSRGESSQEMPLLAELVRNAFRGVSTENKVWFRNARINELPIEAQFYRCNVVAEFEYDEIY